MRKKTNSLIIAFPTTAAAIKMEKKAEEQKVPGRLIPLPREISAGCGLAWKSAPEEEERVMQLIEHEKIPYESKRMMLC